MMGFTSELRPAHKIIQDDWFKLGGRLVRVLGSYPYGVHEQTLTFYFVDRISDDRTVSSIVIPKNVELKVYNQCVLPKVSHKNCPVCGRKK